MGCRTPVAEHLQFTLWNVSRKSFPPCSLQSNGMVEKSM